MMSLATHFSRSSCPPMAYSLPFNAHAARKDLGWFKSPTLSHLYVNMVILRKKIKLAIILTIHLRPSIIQSEIRKLLSVVFHILYHRIVVLQMFFVVLGQPGLLKLPNTPKYQYLSPFEPTYNRLQPLKAFHKYFFKNTNTQASKKAKESVRVLAHYIGRKGRMSGERNMRCS